MVAILSGAEIHLSLEGLIDVAAEMKKLKDEHADLKKYLNGIEAKLKEKAFMEKAPPKVVQMEKKRMEETKGKLKKIEERMKALL